MKKSILMSALLLCIAPSVFGQQKTAYQTRKIAEKDKKQQYKNKEETKRIQKENSVREKAKDILYIKNYIKYEFLRWAKKGEFESSKEHFERIQSERVNKLSQVITDGFRERSINIIGIIDIDLGTYNADEKIYPITINKIYYGGFFKFSVKNNVPLEREEAINLKEAMDGKHGWLNHPEEGPDDWFVKDGFLVPINIRCSGRLIKISDKGNYPLFSEYVFNTNDLGLSEYFPENYTFTLKDYIKSRKKVEEND